MGDDVGMSQSGAEVSLDDLEVVDVPEAGRYEARLGGRRVGVADYHVSEGRVVFPHTEVDPALEGRGIASRLARRALDDARARGLRVVPACSFFHVYLRRNPQDADLLA
jgi:predicted GNAT family acetyltransferase